MLSAGFDARRNDPLGMKQLEDENYVWIPHELLGIQPRFVSVLDGGYSLARHRKLYAFACRNLGR